MPTFKFLLEVYYMMCIQVSKNLKLLGHASYA